MVDGRERCWWRVYPKKSMVIRADCNGHVGQGNRGNEVVMGRFGVKERNVVGQMVVDFV